VGRERRAVAREGPAEVLVDLDAADVHGGLHVGDSGVGVVERRLLHVPHGDGGGALEAQVQGAGRGAPERRRGVLHDVRVLGLLQEERERGGAEGAREEVPGVRGAGAMFRRRLVFVWTFVCNQRQFTLRMVCLVRVAQERSAVVPRNLSFPTSICTHTCLKSFNPADKRLPVLDCALFVVYAGQHVVLHQSMGISKEKGSVLVFHAPTH